MSENFVGGKNKEMGSKRGKEMEFPQWFSTLDAYQNHLGNFKK